MIKHNYGIIAGVLGVTTTFFISFISAESELKGREKERKEWERRLREWEEEERDANREVES